MPVGGLDLAALILDLPEQPRFESPGLTASQRSEVIERLRGKLPACLRHNCVVIGVSPDDCLSHAGSAIRTASRSASSPTPESEVCRKYGVVHEKEANGCRKSCITRSTFIIDKNGTVRHVFYGVNPRGHVAQMLSLVRTLR